MAAYELLLLNTSIPQIQAAQSGDTYLCPRELAVVVNSATDAVRITQTGTGNALIVEDSANPDSTPFVVTATGDVGVGTSSPGSKLQVESATSTTNAKVVSALSGSLFYSAFEVARSGVSAGALMRSARNASTGGVGWEWMTTADNTAEINGTYSSRMTLDSSGNLGLGVTPVSGWDTFVGAQIGGTGGLSLAGLSNNVFMASNLYYGSSQFRYAAASVVSTLYRQTGGAHSWHTTGATTGSAGGIAALSQAMTLDASGNLGIGATSPQARIEAQQDQNGATRIRVNNQSSGASAVAGLDFQAFGGGWQIDVPQSATYANPMKFIFGGSSEKARITAAGYFKASDNGTYNNVAGSFHELYQNSTSEPAVVITTPNASYTGNSVFIEAARNTTNNTFYALSYYNSGAGAYKFRVADSGDVTNTNGTYGTISDAKMKTDIVDAGSQWSDIKALRFRKFKMKDDSSGLVQLGVVAQEVEQTSPGLVDEHADRDADGNDLGTTTKSVKTSVLLMKAAVALQEAMARIEQLEAKVAAMGA